MQGAVSPLSKIKARVKTAEVRVEDQQVVNLYEQKLNTRLCFRSFEVDEITWRPRSPVYLFSCGLISLGLWYVSYLFGKTFFHFLVNCLTG